MNILLISMGLIVALTAETHCAPPAPRQPPAVVGRWKVEFTLSDSATRHLQFDAYASGKGTFLLLDPRSNLVPPAEPTKAEWNQTASGQVSFSGEVEFPIGNVGRQAGTLTLNGAFDSSNSISGNVIFVDSTADAVTLFGTFTAVRVQPLTVRLLSLNAGEKLRRGDWVKLEWEIQSADPIASQQLLLSIDKGRTFYPISATLAGDVRSYIWDIPETLNKTKKAFIRIVVTDEKGNTGDDLTDRMLRIK